ncbi:stigma-specific STIG1-like protein 1 [Pyrus x bretschneideri]|uniref:stigma-specific STIG1-like protein 1 n=1 Tax=Pyrus x bretschneideri TaxID=225117 RepID=UPI000511A027|nr:stigma-specific STIG1-like protein 1 [Pyrus x bretschneideri]
MAMKLMNIFFTLLAAMAIVGAENFHDDHIEDVEMQTSTEAEATKFPEIPDEEEATTSLRGVNRFLYNHNKNIPLPSYNCDNFPRVCRAKNSLGPDCCKKKCVDVKTDRYNCGICGYRCKYTEICCRGKCVNASFDKRHCGGCNQKCKKGDFCVYGMCHYA